MCQLGVQSIDSIFKYNARELMQWMSGTKYCAQCNSGSEEILLPCTAADNTEWNSLMRDQVFRLTFRSTDKKLIYTIHTRWSHASACDHNSVLGYLKPRHYATNDGDQKVLMLATISSPNTPEQPVWTLQALESTRQDQGSMMFHGNVNRMKSVVNFAPVCKTDVERWRLELRSMLGSCGLPPGVVSILMGYNGEYTSDFSERVPEEEEDDDDADESDSMCWFQ